MGLGFSHTLFVKKESFSGKLNKKFKKINSYFNLRV